MDGLEGGRADGGSGGNSIGGEGTRQTMEAGQV